MITRFDTRRMTVSEILKCFSDRKFSREWGSNTDKSRYLESLIARIPGTPIWLDNRKSWAEVALLDGSKRLSALRQFLEGKLILSDLELLPEFNGCSRNTMPRGGLVRRIEETMLAVNMVEQCDPHSFSRISSTFNLIAFTSGSRAAR